MLKKDEVNRNNELPNTHNDLEPLHGACPHQEDRHCQPKRTSHPNKTIELMVDDSGISTFVKLTTNFITFMNSNFLTSIKIGLSIVEGLVGRIWMA